MNRRAIAIVAAAGHFPGAPDLDSLWKLILGRESVAKEVPPSRWAVAPDAILTAPLAPPDHLHSLRGCYLEEIPAEPAHLDPVHRLALAVGRRAFAEARTDGVDRSRIGVFLANIALPTEAASAFTRQTLGEAFASWAGGEGFDRDGAAISPLERHTSSLPAALLASELGLGGGHSTLDAACASSLYALHLACMELEAGRLDAALAGGVSRPQCLYTQVGFSQLQALSPSGSCSPFTTEANGLVVGEGAGIFVLKRLEDAEAAGDRILGVIRAIGLSNDVGGSLLSPETEGQRRAMDAAYEAAGWSPADVDLVECHGTGTPRGDSVELESLGSLLSASDRKRPVAIGSVKANIGHTLTAAGAAGLSKVLLSLQHGVLPPGANYQKEKAVPALLSGRLFVPEEPLAWEEPEGHPRRAAVSAFGFGGINAHLLVEAYEGSSSASSFHGPKVDTAALAASAEHDPAGLPGEIDAREESRPAAKVTRIAAVTGTTSRPDGVPSAAEPIALVGLAAHFGGLEDLHAFREAALKGEPVFRPLSQKRAFGLDDLPWLSGAFLEEIAVPAGRFRIPPRELGTLLPQQLLALQVASDAVADSGLLKEKGPHLRTGALVGLGLDPETTSFHLRWLLRQNAAAWAKARGENLASEALDAWVDELLAGLGPSLDSSRTLGALGGVVAGRIARELRLGGPAFAIAAAELSGLRALETATRLLQRGEVDAMVVAAVDLAGDIRHLLQSDALRPFSRSGQPRPFDESADGSLPGEGATAVVAKRLADAERDGDRIYAVLKGIGSAGGSTPGAPLEAPVYELALRRAFDEAAIEPSRVSLIETHGSGVPAEDREEATALHRFFRAPGSRSDGNGSSEATPDGHIPSAAAGDNAVPTIALSSLRATVGDTGAAAGLASLVKTALALFHEVLPAIPTVDRPLSTVDWDEGPFHLPNEPLAWVRNRAEGPRVAGVSAIGRDGACMHLVLEGIDRPADTHRVERARPLGERKAALFLIQGDVERGIEELKGLAARERSLETCAARWYRQHGYTPGTPTKAFVATSLTDLLAKMDRPFPATPSIQGKVAFVFPGSGNHFLGMGRSLGVAFPEVVRNLDEETGTLLDQLMPAFYGPFSTSWTEEAKKKAAERLAAEPARLMLGQVAYGISMSDTLRWLGVKPDAAIGYSLGESAALYSMRAWRDREGMFRRTLHSPLFENGLVGRHEVARRAWGVDHADWHVVVVNRSSGEVRGALQGTAALLIVNAPGECVIGGDRADVEKTVSLLQCEAIAIHGVPAVHCEVATEVADAYRDLHVQPTHPPQDIRFYSCGFAKPYTPSTDGAADSILQNALHGFDFPALIERAWEDGVRIFVEAGPQGSCTRMISRILKGKEHLALTACHRDRDAAESVLLAIGRLAEAGVPVDLENLYGASSGISIECVETNAAIRIPVGRERPQLPTPPWSRQPAPALFAPPVPEMSQSSFVPPADGAPISSDVSSGHEQQHTIPAAMPAASLPGIGAEATPMQTVGVQPDLRVAHAAATSVPAHAAGLPGSGAPILALGPNVLAAAASTAAAHASFLHLSQHGFALQQEAIATQQRLIAMLGGAADTLVWSEAVPVAASLPVQAAPMAPTAPITLPSSAANHATSLPPSLTVSAGAPQPSAATAPAAPLAFDRDQCMEFAVGSIAKVLGPEYAVVDTYPTRVRLPDEPLMLVDRILHVEGTKGEPGWGRIVTQHDVHPGAWYLDGGRSPVCISVESGQADLFLCAWLGMDLITEGQRVYRLLDAQVIFHRDLPKAGEVVTYDIKISKFIRQGDTHLLFFEFDGTIDGEPLITMRNGCAGFFSPLQLSSGRGIVGDLPSERPARRLLPDGKPTAPFGALLPMAEESYGDEQIDALRRGDAEACFGPLFAGITLPEGLRLPGGKMQLVDRILSLEPEGGRYGLGRITGEADIQPDDWFLTCHFDDDPVMPGTLMYECSLHTLRVFLLRMGWACDVEGAPADLHHAPVMGATSQLRCRGQVIPTTKKVRYRIDIKEIGADPEPYVLADASMFVDDLHAVEMEGMSVRIVGLTDEFLKRFWAGRTAPAAPPRTFGRSEILAFATGSPIEAFGDRYAPFAAGRRMARLPAPPFSFVDSIRATEGQQWVLAPGARAEASYTVPKDAWYFTASRQASMPYAILLEAALQPCGWLAAYLGSALCSDEDLFFRNLEGEATIHREVLPDEGELTTQVRLDSVSQAGGMILQQFTFAMESHRGPVFSGTTRFGFFPEASLAQQAGIRVDPSSLWRPGNAKGAFPIARTAPLLPVDAGSIGLPGEKPGTPAIPPKGLLTPSGAWQMLDRIDALELDGGPASLGAIAGSKDVNPEEWFFVAHFFQDPVMPGSLGVEAFVQLLQHWARARFPALADTHRFEAVAADVPHKWTYRGQVRPHTEKVEVFATVTSIEEGPSPLILADGYLVADGTVIYSMAGFGLRLIPLETN